MNHWTYKGKVITCLEDIENYESIVGFVYIIRHKKTGKLYVGKKSLHSSRKTRITKKEKLATSTQKTFKRVIKQSDWLGYYGSCIPLKAQILELGIENYTREILEFCCSKKYLSYCEVAYQIKLDVLNADSYNGNIMSRWFHKDMQNCIK